MRPEFRFGLLAAAGMSGWLLLENLLGLHTRHLGAAAYTHWGTEVVLVAALYLLLRAELRRLNRYWLPLWEGVLRGTLMSLVAALAFYAFTAVYVFVLHPDWPDLRLAHDVALMRAAEVPEAEIREYARRFRQAFTPGGLALFVVGLYTIVGGLASSVLTLWINWRHKESLHGG